MAYNTIITELNLDHTRDAFLQLNKEGVLCIKLWIGFDVACGKYGTVAIKNGAEIDELYFLKSRIFCEQKYYEQVYENLADFINLQSRWEETVETYNYIEEFNIYINFWYRVFKQEKIDILIHGIVPHGGFNYIGYLLAQAMGIKVIILHQTGINGKFSANNSIRNIGNVDFRHNGVIKKISLEKNFKKELAYMKDITPAMDCTRVSIISLIKNYLKRDKIKSAFLRIYQHRKVFFEKCFETMGYQFINRYLQKKFFEDKKKRMYTHCDFNQKYVYFPLHFQPELSTDSLGGKYSDQLLAIERLSALLPPEWVIYVKDNPKQSYYKRSTVFFKRLFSIENVKLVSYQVNTYDLISKAQFVATITGTAGWEAISGGKNALVFGYAWYRSLPGVFEYNENFRLQDILEYSIDHPFLESKYNELYNSLYDGVVANEAMKDCDDDYDPVENNKKIYNAMKEIINQL
ncbi:MAG: hypothetical protein ACRC7I_13200 [Selenomonadaceae bacterium]